MTEHEMLRRKLLKRYKAILEECEQLIRDKEWWNENRKDAAPFDVGWERVAADGLTKAIAALERDEPLKPEWFEWTNNPTE